MGNALIDTGSQVSLVKETGLARGLKIKRQLVKIHGITGNVMEAKGKVDLGIGETSLHEFMLVSDLPMKCDILLGQDWLERFGYQFQIPELGINLPAYSETLVRIPTTEKGSRLLEAEELEENVFCSSGVVECVDNSFICLVINCNPTDKTLRKFPRTQELPKLSGKFVDAKGRVSCPESSTASKIAISACKRRRTRT